MQVVRSPWWKMQQYFCIVLLLVFVSHIGWVFYGLIEPFLGFKTPDSQQFFPSESYYEDTGREFPQYVKEVRAHLARYRLPVEHKSFSDQVQLGWAAPYTQKTARDCQRVRGRALLIHGLYGSAYQMSDIANALSKACFESDVMLLPGHGTRVADLTKVSASAYLDSVHTRMEVFRRSCRNCLVVGYSMGSLLATLALMENSSNIHGFVSIAPAWMTSFDVVSGLLPLVNEIYDYSPMSRQTMLPTHYSYESIYAATQLFALKHWLFQKMLETPGSLAIPGLVVVAEDDQVISIGDTIEISPAIFSQVPEFLIYSETPSPYRLQFQLMGADNTRVEILQSSWPDYRIETLSHFGLVYAPGNFLYGFNGIYGSCMEPAGFSCDNLPIEIRYRATRGTFPEDDVALTPAHPEFDRMMASVVRFLNRSSLIER